MKYFNNSKNYFQKIIEQDVIRFLSFYFDLNKNIEVKFI
jgi:hypothetical protein